MNASAEPSRRLLPHRAVSVSRALVALALGLSLTGVGQAAWAAPAAGTAAESAGDLAAARQLFERNLQAIRDKDKAAYLACYLESPGLARTGSTGFELGYEGLAKSAGEGWPDHFGAEDLRLTPIAPGVVYGTYRYRVRYGASEEEGLSERVFLHTPAGWRIAVSTAFRNQPGVPPAPRALVGATLVDGTGRPPIRDSAVLLRDGRIECAGARADCPVPAGVEVTDLAGRFITPGLVDAHVHFSQTGWADGRPDALDLRARYPYEKTEDDLRHHPERFGHTDLCSGVTAVFDVGGYPWTLELPRRFEPDTTLPHVAAAGPLLSTVDHWLNLPAERQFIFLKDEAAARDGVDYLAASGAQAIKVWFIGSREKVPALAPLVAAGGAEAKRLGLPLIAHATTLATAKAALRAGAKVLVHSVWDMPIDGEFLELVKANGASYVPTLTVPAGYVRMFDAAAAGKAPAIDDPNGCVDPLTRAKLAATAEARTDKVAAAKIAKRPPASPEPDHTGDANLKRVRDAGITIAMGTDAGNPLTLHGPGVYAEMEAMQAAGMTPLEVIVASTRNGAHVMGREKDFGTVEKGKLADLLIVGADPTADVANLRQVKAVVRGGVLRSIDELRALATVEEKPTAQ